MGLPTSHHPLQDSPSSILQEVVCELLEPAEEHNAHNAQVRSGDVGGWVIDFVVRSLC